MYVFLGDPYLIICQGKDKNQVLLSKQYSPTQPQSYLPDKQSNFLVLNFHIPTRYELYTPAFLLHWFSQMRHAPREDYMYIVLDKLYRLVPRYLSELLAQRHQASTFSIIYKSLRKVVYFYKILFIAKSFSISFSIKVLIDFVSSFSKSNEKVDQQCSRCTIFLNSFLINHSIFKGYVDFLYQGHKYYISQVFQTRGQFLIPFLFF